LRPPVAAAAGSNPAQGCDVVPRIPGCCSQSTESEIGLWHSAEAAERKRAYLDTLKLQLARTLNVP
jgi:hypothetical protein